MAELYELTVSGIGLVYAGDRVEVAIAEFEEHKKRSINPSHREVGAEVILRRNGAKVKVWSGTRHQLIAPTAVQGSEPWWATAFGCVFVIFHSLWVVGVIAALIRKIFF